MTTWLLTVKRIIDVAIDLVLVWVALALIFERPSDGALRVRVSIGTTVYQEFWVPRHSAVVTHSCVQGPQADDWWGTWSVCYGPVVSLTSTNFVP